MQKNTLDHYKAAIKAKYEEEKSRDYSSFLMNPSRAKLRDLCIVLFNGIRNVDDLKSFHTFFGFEFKEDNLRELKNNTDKFRPIETFFKGETDLTDISGVDLAAILVSFNPRPLQRFLKQTEASEVSQEESATYSITDTTVDFTQKKESTSIPEAIVIQEYKIKSKILSKATLVQIPQKTISVKQIFKMLALLIIISVSGYGAREFFFPKKQCMQWQKDHYEVVDCNGNIQGIAAMNEVKPIFEEELKLKKIEVTTQTPFFQNKKAVVWYCKNNGKLEYFNAAGFHPENSKPLKPITKYIIEKYIKSVRCN